MIIFRIKSTSATIISLVVEEAISSIVFFLSFCTIIFRFMFIINK